MRDMPLGKFPVCSSRYKQTNARDSMELWCWRAKLLSGSSVRAIDPEWQELRAGCREEVAVIREL